MLQLACSYVCSSSNSMLLGEHVGFQHCAMAHPLAVTHSVPPFPFVTVGPVPFTLKSSTTGRCLRPVGSPYSEGQGVMFMRECSNGAEPLWTYNAVPQVRSPAGVGASGEHCCTLAMYTRGTSSGGS